jgi:hypothetical protein
MDEIYSHFQKYRGLKSLLFIEFIYTRTATPILSVIRGAQLFQLLATQPSIYLPEDRGTILNSNYRRTGHTYFQKHT